MYNVNLDVFQGPLDLLLHLIEKMEIDIYNIPIAKLTESYLDYINNNDEFSLENAEEYIVMAATLIHIKSKSLLPVFNDDEQDIVEDDLVQQLIEYKNYKELSQKLEALHQSRAQYLEKESIDIETEVDLRNLNISSNKLLHAMENILKTFDNNNDQSIISYKREISLEKIKAGKVKDKAVAKACIMDREKKMSTGMKHGIAIPHGKTDSISSLVACIGISEKPVDFDSLDQEPARIFIMTLSPIDKTGPHLQFLAEVSLLFKSAEKRQEILNTTDKSDIIRILTE